MGFLSYDSVNVEFDDRALLHLQIVIVQKLRRGESFLMSWRDSDTVGSGRSSIWLHPAIPLYFKFAGSRIPTVNRAWISALATTADGAHGLTLTPEPDDPAPRIGNHPTTSTRPVHHTRATSHDAHPRDP
jgi:hypothetical protein